MSRFLPWLLLALLVHPSRAQGGSPAPGTGAGPPSGYDADSLAQQFLQRHGYVGADPSTFDVQGLLDTGFLRLRVGLFDLYLDRTSASEAGASEAGASEAGASEEFTRVGTALVRLQEAWLDWTEPLPIDQKDARKDLNTIAGFVRGISASGIARAAANGKAGDLIDVLGARESVREAADRFGLFMATGASLGLEREARFEKILVAPRRVHFLELTGFGGWLLPHLQPRLWADDVVFWTNCYMGDLRVMATQFAAPDGSSTSYLKGRSMSDKVEDGLEQQFTQLAALALMDNTFGGRVSGAVAQALSVMITIDVFGQCRTRVDGDLRERRTEAYEMFVPGGASEGGELPANAADSRWRREKHGADYFVTALKASQKQGAKLARGKPGKLRHFELENDGATDRMLVSGPFMGLEARGREAPPAEYRGDHLEFLRSYGTCFVHFLRTAGAGNAKASGARFAAWLEALALDSEEPFEGLTRRVWNGAALSDAEPGADTLEGKFLLWLSKR